MSVDPRGGLLLPESQQELTKDALSRNLMESLFNPQPGGNLSLGGFGGNNPTYYNHLFGGAFGGAGGSESGLMHSSMVGPNGVEAELSPTDGDMAAFMKHALDELDNNPKFNFVEKYAYFYLATGSLMETATSLSSIGNIYITQ